MYCCKCGNQVFSGATYCHKCGSLVFTAQEREFAEQRENERSQTANSADRALVEDLLKIDAAPEQCHACGQTQRLRSWEFGLGKPVSTQREWTGTAVSIALSAVTLPLIGYGMLRMPGSSTRLRVLRMKLVLCADCHERKKGYEMHPWWKTLHLHGYTHWVDSEELKKLR